MGHLSPFVQSCSEAGFPPLCRGEAPSHKRRITLALSSRGWSEGRGAGLGHLHRQGLSKCSEQKRVKILQAKIPWAWDVQGSSSEEGEEHWEKEDWAERGFPPDSKLQRSLSCRGDWH